jgi:hypothetical protein
MRFSLQCTKVNLHLFSDIMDTWTRQMGFPVLQIERLNTGGGLNDDDSGEISGGGGEISGGGGEISYLIRQERFLLNAAEMNSSAAAASPYGYKWEVPVTWITSADPLQPARIQPHHKF